MDTSTMEAPFLWFFRIANLIFSITLTNRAFLSLKMCGKKYWDYGAKIFILLTGAYWTILSVYLIYLLFVTPYPAINVFTDELARGGITLLLIIACMFTNYFSRG